MPAHAIKATCHGLFEEKKSIAVIVFNCFIVKGVFPTTPQLLSSATDFIAALIRLSIYSIIQRVARMMITILSSFQLI